MEKAFFFHTGLDQYAGVYASSLDDFCRKILAVNLGSIEFHLLRRDFESWFNYLGDKELAEKIGLIRGRGLFGEVLRKELYGIVKSRRDELVNLGRF